MLARLGGAQSLSTQSHISVATEHLSLAGDLGDMFNVADFKFELNYQRQHNEPFWHVFPAGSVLPMGQDGNIDFVNPVNITVFSDGYIGAPYSYGKSANIKLTQIIDIKSHRVRWQAVFDKTRLRTVERKNFGPGILDGTQLVVDGTLTHITGTYFVFIPDLSRDFYFLSLLDEWQVNDSLIINLGARYDHYSDFGSTTNPRLSALWQLDCFCV
jgi:outer membrane receptor for ferrienterochelin and colicins